MCYSAYIERKADGQGGYDGYFNKQSENGHRRIAGCGNDV